MRNQLGWYPLSFTYTASHWQFPKSLIYHVLPMNCEGESELLTSYTWGSIRSFPWSRSRSRRTWLSSNSRGGGSSGACWGTGRSNLTCGRWCRARGHTSCWGTIGLWGVWSYGGRSGCQDLDVLVSERCSRQAGEARENTFLGLTLEVTHTCHTSIILAWNVSSM